MAVDVRGFVTPEQKFEGIYQLDETLQRNRLQQQRDTERQRELDEAKRGKTAASLRYFTNYLDPKDRYTGTNYDPKINEFLGDALGQAYDLASKGANEAEILTAISPIVNKANQYQQKASMYAEGKKQLLSNLKGLKGYNPEQIGSYLDKEMFEGKDINSVDPADMPTALNNIFSKYGSQITNDEALDEYIKKIPTSKVTTDLISYNARGGKQRNKATVDMPNIFIQEEENGQTKFVPKFDKATDFGEDIMGDFVDENGKHVQAPVRLLDENVFDQVIRSSPGVKHRVEALVNEAIQSGKYNDAKGNPISLSSPQAKNLARAILYDELKSKAQVQSNILQESKPAQIRNTTNVIMPSGAPEGNEFDNIPKGQISKSGVEYIEPSDIPTNMAVALKAYGAANLNADELKYLEIYRGADGSIDYVIPILRTLKADGEEDESKPLKAGKKITRDEMRNAQLKFNNEPQKGEQLKFGADQPKSNNKEDLRKKYGY